MSDPYTDPEIRKALDAGQPADTDADRDYRRTLAKADQLEADATATYLEDADRAWGGRLSGRRPAWPGYNVDLLADPDVVLLDGGTRAVKLVGSRLVEVR